MIHRFHKLLPVVLMPLFMYLGFSAKAQSGVCDPTTPFYVVNLDGDPAGTFTTPPDVRTGNCCGTKFPDRCIEFEITLDQNAVGISFDIYSGAVPSGSMYYQIGCGPYIPVGQHICLADAGPHTLTFCKPGNNPNAYIIQSIPPSYDMPDSEVRIGCSIELNVYGFVPSSVVWTDITGGGTYDSLLTCTTGCTTTYFNPVPGTPSKVDYLVCGYIIDSTCYTLHQICDTVSVEVFPEIIVPDLDTVLYCASDGGVLLQGNAFGGVGTYEYYWFDNAGNQLSSADSYFVNTPGMYVLEIRDELYPNCPAEIQDIRVIADQPAYVNAGPDTLICSANPLVGLSGFYSGTTGAYWQGGSGSYLYPVTVMSNRYQPTSAEVQSGSITLNLVSVADTVCPVQTDALVVNFSTPPVIALDSYDDVSCYGAADGFINVSVGSGISPYGYVWSGGQTTQDVSGLDTGTYTLVVSDVLGCTDTLVQPIVQPAPIAVTLSPTNVSCYGSNNGQVLSTVVGGTAPYTYSWSNGPQTSYLNNVGPGIYTVTVSDANGCSNTATAAVSEPTQLLITETLSHVSCFGGSNGSASTVVSGGQAPYTYNWSSGPQSSGVNGLSAGTYTLTITDASGCSVAETYTITQPAQLVASPLILNHVSCNGGSDGSATAIVSGGTKPYSFAWSTASTDSIETSLSAGTHVIAVVDNNGCTVSTSMTISQPDSLVLALSKVDVACFGSNNGTINTTISGGTPPYTYAWSNASTATNLSNLAPGTYTLTLTDANGCTTTGSASIVQPTQLIITETLNNISCYSYTDGSVSAVVSGGVPPYSYSWSQGGQSSAIGNLGAGTYGLTVTDATGCTMSESYTLTQPPVFTISPLVLNHVSCYGGNDGSATSVLNGGVAPYSFVWSTGSTDSVETTLAAGQHSISATDNNGCMLSVGVNITQPDSLTLALTMDEITCNGDNDGAISTLVAGGTAPYSYAWSHGSGSANISSLTPQLYVLTVTDNNGCTISSSANLVDPAPISHNFAVVDVNCYGTATGSVDLTMSGGVMPFTFNWSGISSNQEDLTNLYTGNYAVTATDTRGCAYTAATVVNEPDSISIIASKTDVSCFGLSDGSANLAVSGGTAGYNYSWSNGGINNGIAGVIADMYAYTVTDANGCSKQDSIAITQPDSIQLSLAGTEWVCRYSTDGYLYPLTSGGTPSYSYDWSNGSTDSLNNNLSAGTYSLTVTDANGCQNQETIDITEIVLSVQVLPGISCVGDTTHILGTSNQDSSVVSWNWSFGDNTTGSGQAVSHIYTTQGTYTVKLIAEAVTGCIDSATATIGSYPLPIIDAGNDRLICYGDTTVLTATGGQLYTWSPAQYLSDYQASTVMAFPTDTTLFHVTGIDINGCVNKDSVKVNVAPLPQPDIGPDVTLCMGDNTTLNGGTWAGYNWIQGDGLSCTGCADPKATPLQSNQYVLQVSDNLGCVGYDSLYITVNPRAGGIKPYSSNMCQGTSAIISGEAGHVSYHWEPASQLSNPDQMQISISPEVTTTYYLETINSYGCVTNDSARIVVTPIPSLDFAYDAEICAGDTAQIEIPRGVNVTWYHAAGISQVGNTVYIHPQASAHYDFTANIGNGCDVRGELEVIVNQPPDLQMPNAFVSCKGEEIPLPLYTAGDSVSFSWSPPTGLDDATSMNPLATISKPASYMVTATSKEGCVSQAAIQVDVVEDVALIDPSVSEICEGQSVQLSFPGVSNGLEGVTYTWYDENGKKIGSNVPISVAPRDDKTYTLIAERGTCKPDTTVFNVNVNELPWVKTSERISAYIGETIVLAAASSSEDNLLFWEGADTLCMGCNHTEVRADSVLRYWVTALDKNGCIAKDSVDVLLYTVCTDEIYVPNAFTPNGDDINDEFRPRSRANFGIEVFRVFDRWGNLMFETDNIDEGWDGHYRGRPADEAVYVYYIQATCKNGVGKLLKGNVTLIR